MSLRHRILLTLLPLFVLLAVMGGYGIALLYRLGGRIDDILRENYASVVYMERLKESLERMDSSFQFALAGREVEAREQFEANWQSFSLHLADERDNVTLPGEGDLVARLEQLGQEYRQRGAAFYAASSSPAREADYFGTTGKPGLLATFKQLKETADEILRINQENMEEANRQARSAARSSLFGFVVCLGLTSIVGALLALRIVNAVLSPVKRVTESVAAIGAGDLDQIVPAESSDELGELAVAVNSMARQLREHSHSQRARLLRVQQATQATIDSFPDPVVVVDRNSVVEMANPAARRVLGLGFERQASQVQVPWRPPAALRDPLTAALQQERAHLPEGFDQAIAISLDNKPRFFLPRILPIRDVHDGPLGAAILLADVTRFQLLDQVKSDLVATVSHELKTPLASVRMAIHLLLEEAVGPLTPKQTELLIEARAGAERMLAMINNLLDLARLEKGTDHLQLRRERPAEVLARAAELVRGQARDQGIELSIEAPPGLPAIEVDAHVFDHALRNLLDNAVTYTPRGGRIALRADAEGDSVVLTVTDTGPGIPPEYLPHVFERFFRVPGQSQGSGTGLGLAIVREIALAHGGDVKCHSAPGKGTRFEITLPAADPAAQPGINLNTPHQGSATAQSVRGTAREQR